MRPRESPHSLDKYVNSQLPSTDTHIVRGCNLHTTYCPTNMQTASSCHSPKYATTRAAVSRHRTGVCREFPHIRRSPSSLHSWPIHPFIHSFSPPENTSQMRACACLPVAASAVAAPRGGAAATQPSPGGTRSPRRSG